MGGFLNGFRRGWTESQQRTFNQVASYAFWALLAVIVVLAILGELPFSDAGSTHEVQTEAR